MAHAIEQIVLSNIRGKSDTCGRNDVLHRIAQGLLNTNISLQDVVCVGENEISVHHSIDIHEEEAYSTVMPLVYQVSHTAPFDKGMVTGDTAIIIGHLKVNASCTLEESISRESIMHSKIQLDNITQRLGENSKHSNIDIEIEPCPYLLGYDGVIFLPKEVMRKFGIESTQVIRTKKRALHVASDDLTSILPRKVNLRLQSQCAKGVGLVSPVLHFNMGHPRELSLTLDTTESNDHLAVSTDVVLHPLTKWDLYSSSFFLSLEESIQIYVHRQGRCTSWVKGDIVAIPIIPKSAQAKYELAFARSKDFIEHKYVDCFGGKYIFLRVGSSGTHGATVILGNPSSIEENQYETTCDFSESNFNYRQLLPSIPAPRIVTMSPSYSEIRKIVQRLSLASSSNRDALHTLSKGNQYGGKIDVSTLPCNCAVIYEVEGNFAQEAIFAAVSECGFSKPVLLPTDGLPCDDIEKAASVCSKDRTNALVFSVTSGFDVDMSKFFDGLRQIISRLPKDIMTIVHLTIDPPLSFVNRFPYFLKVENPSKQERLALITAIRDSFALSFEVSSQFSQKTNHMSFSDIFQIFSGFLPGRSITQEHLQSRIEEHALRIGIQTSKSMIETVKWDDIGGLVKQKDQILTRLSLPLAFQDDRDVRTSGILLYGPPGCGKTLLAKAVANEFNIGFLNIKGPELLNMYVGQSERNVRETFRKASAMAPCILFFDEIDALAPSRSNHGEIGGALSRVVSQLATEIDDIHNSDTAARVFIFGATNRIDLIDQGLLRPGRFDFTCYIGPPESKKEIVEMLESQLRKVQLHEDVCLNQFADALPSGLHLTGADIAGIVASALLNSFNESGNFVVKQKYLIEALNEVLETSEFTV